MSAPDSSLSPGRKLLLRFNAGRFTRSVAILAGGTALGQAIALAAAPVLTRLYTPEDFGILGVYASLLGICSAVACLRYDFAIPIPENDRDAAALVTLCLIIIPFNAGLLGGGIWVLRYQITEWTQTPGLGSYLWLVPCGIALWGTYNVLCYWAVRRRAFPRIARTKLTQALSMLFTQIVFFPLGALGLLLGHVASGTMGIGTLASLARHHDGRFFRGLGWHDALDVATRFRRFPIYSAPSGLVGTAGILSPLLIFSALYGPYAAGQLALVQRVAGVPLTLIGTAVNQVYFSEGASALRQGPISLRSLFLQTSFKLACLASIPAAVLILAGPTLFPVVFGEQWQAAGHWSRYLGCMLALQLIASPVSQTLNLLNRQNWQLLWDLFRLTLVFFSFGLSHYNRWLPDTAVFAYAVALGCAYIALWIMQLCSIESANLRAQRHRING